MHRSQREALARELLSYSKAEQTEVIVGSSESALMRFTHGVSNQNVASSNASIAVRAIVGGRTGVAATNALDTQSLRDVAAHAISMAELSPIDPNQPTLPTGGTYVEAPGGNIAATAEATPAQRAAFCDQIFREAESAGQWSAGFASTSSAGITIANTVGACASYEGTDAAINVKMTAADSTGFAEGYANDVARLDATALARRAVEKARGSAKPRNVDPGAWTVILEPAAFGELLDYAVSHFSAQSYDEGSSFFAGKLNERFFPENVTISDDYTHPLAPGMPFDYEGQPKLRLPLIEAGVTRNVVTDSYYANKLRLPNTGHALPAPNAHGPQATNIVVAPGTLSRDELISTVKRGLLITRFWYIRTVDEKLAKVTGMTRDGTFLIEDGKIAGGVRNMRFNQSILEVLRNVTLANDQTRTGSYYYSLVAPTAKVQGFTFTSGTEF